MDYTVFKSDLSYLTHNFCPRNGANVRMDNSNLKVSGSNWNRTHLRALRVKLFEDVPFKRLFGDWWPSDDDQG